MSNGHQCVYCAFCIEGDCYYCTNYEKVLKESTIRRENKCPDFVMSDLGACDTGKPYVPRIRHKKVPDGQRGMEL